MKQNKYIVLVCLCFLSIPLWAQLPALIDTSANWHLNWSDEFDYSNEDLDNDWIAQNRATGGVVLCSRWRENAVVANGILELQAKKETKAGQDWTAASIWTKEDFRYGYFECRYKYAGATGTNNSFWLYPYAGVESGGKAFELDINEGQYPNVVKTNIHNWTDDIHLTQNKYYVGDAGTSPSYTHILKVTITTTKIKFSSTHQAHFHIGEFRVYAPNANGYPSNALSESADTDVAGLHNYSRDAGTTITASGQYTVEGRNTDPENVADGAVATVSKSWIAPESGEKWLVLTFDEAKEIGCIQFTNGWLSGSSWNALIDNYLVEYWDNGQWVKIAEFDKNRNTNLAEEYHTYGLLWTPTEHKFYFDGELIRSKTHELNNSKTKILLSLAILDMNIGGPVTDAIDGTSMKVDYVRHYTTSDYTSLANTIFDASDINVYPNPSRGLLYVSNVENSASVIISNLAGRIVLKNTLNNSIDVSFLSSGVYIYTIVSGTRIATGKFLKK